MTVMLRLLKIHLIFLVIALAIAFIFVPLDMSYFREATDEEVSLYLNGAFTLEYIKAWKIAFTWFVGLTCGRLMIRALMSNS